MLIPNIASITAGFDGRLDKLEKDMHNMVSLLVHIDKTLTKLVDIQEQQLDATLGVKRKTA